MHADVPGKPGSMADDVKSEAGRVEGGREMGGGETESVIFILFIVAEWPSPTSSSYLSSRRISTLRGREWSRDRSHELGNWITFSLLQLSGSSCRSASI